jgi:hypothetical protein
LFHWVAGLPNEETHLDPLSYLLFTVFSQTFFFLLSGVLHFNSGRIDFLPHPEKHSDNVESGTDGSSTFRMYSGNTNDL